MKRKHTLLILIALAAAVLLGSQVWRLHAVAAANDDLHQRLAEIVARNQVRSAPPKPKEPPPPSWEQTQSEVISLTKALETENAHGLSSTLARAKLNQRLRTLSTDDLMLLRTRLDQAGLPPGQWVAFERALQWVVVEKAPGRLLKESSKLLDEKQFQGTLTWALWRWMTLEPEAAMAWLDAQRASGVFHRSLDGRRPNLLGFEESTTEVLLADEPDAAESRLGTLDESERVSLLDRTCDKACDGGQGVAWARLVLSVLPAEVQQARIQGAARHLAFEDGLEAAVPVLDLVADPKTRQAATSEAVEGALRGMAVDEQTLDGAALDKVADWVKTREPKECLSLTGLALGRFWTDGPNGRQVEEFVKRAAATGDADDLAAAFLREAATQHPPRQRLADMLSSIRNPERREQARTELENSTPDLGNMIRRD